MVRIDSNEAQIDAIILDDKVTAPTGIESGNTALYTTVSGVYIATSGSNPVGLLGQIGTCMATVSDGHSFTNTYTEVDFDNVNYDPDSTITTGSNWKWTAPYDCIVTVNYSLGMSSGAELQSLEMLNNVSQGRTRTAPVTSSWNSLSGGFTWKVEKNDYISIDGYCGTTQDAVTSWCRFHALYIRII